MKLIITYLDTPTGGFLSVITYCLTVALVVTWALWG